MARPQDLVDAARGAGVRDARVLDAIASVPRAGFVPDDVRARAYLDVPLSIPHDQVTTQPSLVARMLEGLVLRGQERVLEVGGGYGWQTALLARLAREVVSVERWSDLAAAAVANLEAAGIGGWEVAVGDGTAGLARRAPYDAILVAAAHPQVPATLVGQLVTGGRLVQPIGPGGHERVVAFTKVGGGLVEREVLTAAHFVPLWGRHGFPSPEGDER